MKRVALLQEDLGGAHEQPRAVLPADDVAPLVDLHREITPRVDPVGVHGADDGLAGRTHRQPLLELLAAAAGHPGDLGVEPLDVVRLLLEVRLRDEQREVHVLVAGTLDHVVERALDVLPQGEAVGSDHHAAAHRRVVGELGPTDHIRVPAIEIVALRGDPLFVGHGRAVYVRTPSRSLKPTGNGLPSAIRRASSSAISCNSSSSALTRSPSGSVETTLPLRYRMPFWRPPAMPMSACMPSPGPLTTQPITETVMVRFTPSSALETCATIGIMSISRPPQVGQATRLGPSPFSWRLARIWRATRTSSSGEPTRETRMVSPRPSARSRPMPRALLMLPVSTGPASVSPRCSG